MVTTGLKTAILAMRAPEWEVRNAAFQAFTALIVRTLGFRNQLKVGLCCSACLCSKPHPVFPKNCCKDSELSLNIETKQKEPFLSAFSEKGQEI